MKTEAKTSSKTPAEKNGRNAFRNERLNSSTEKGEFTNLIIEKLEQGVIPWNQPWHEMGLPSNYLTKKAYKGINLWLLLSFNHQ